MTLYEFETKKAKYGGHFEIQKPPKTNSKKIEPTQVLFARV